MGNTTTQSPWILDTASTTTYILAAGNRIQVNKMIWYPNAANNDIIIKDGNGNEKWNVRATADSANKESYGAEHFTGPEEFDGFQLHTLDGGSVYVYFEVLT